MTENAQKRSANLLFAVTFFFWFAQYGYSSYINPELERMGASATYMGLVTSMYGLTQTLLRIPLGIAADRLNRQKLFIVIGCAASALSALGMYLFYQPAGFLAFRALSGVASASWVCFTVLYSRYFKPEESAGRITQLNVSNQSGRLLCFMVIGAALSIWSVRAAFLISALGGLIAVVLAFQVKDRPAQSTPASLKAFLSVMKERNLMSCSLLAALSQMVAFSTIFSFASNIQKNIGAADGELSYLNIALMVPTILANILVTRLLLSKRSPNLILCTGYALIALYCVLMARASAVWQLYCLQVLAGAGNSCTLSVLLGQSVRDVGPSHRATAMGFFQAVYGIGMTIGPMLMGVLVDGLGLSISFDVMAVFSAASIPLALALTRRKTEDTASC